jgi:hypothetical protein
LAQAFSCCSSSIIQKQILFLDVEDVAFHRVVLQVPVEKVVEKVVEVRNKQRPCILSGYLARFDCCSMLISVAATQRAF